MKIENIKIKTEKNEWNVYFDMALAMLDTIMENNVKGKMICTPKVRHFWRCIFLWQRKGNF